MRLLVFLVLALVAAPAHSAELVMFEQKSCVWCQLSELVMFEQKSCVWCQRFDRDTPPAYDKTSEGKRAPLRRLDITQPVPADLAFIRRERFTPVFVLIDQGREIGRAS